MTVHDFPSGDAVASSGHRPDTGPVDSPAPAMKNAEMETMITREELDARLQANEAKTEAAIARIEGKLDTSNATMSGKLDRVLDQLGANSKEQQGMLQRMEHFQRELSNAKWWAIGTGIVVILGVWQVNTGVVQSVISAFEAGRGIAPKAADALPPVVPKK